MKNKVASEPVNVKNGNKPEQIESSDSDVQQKQAAINRIVRLIEEKVIWRIVGFNFFWTTIIFTILTYFRNSEPSWLQIINFFVLIIFLIDFLIRLYVSTHRLYFLTSTDSLKDFFIILPLFLIDNRTTDSYIFLSSVSYLLRSTNAGTIFIKSVRIVETDVSKQILTIIITLSLLVYISAGMFMAAENLARSDEEKLKFHQCIYFITVTLSTVGYGDLAPQTELGRILVIIVIIMTIAIIPRQIGELLRLLGMQSIYEREIYKANSEVPHIIWTGQITFDALKNCCDDLFHEDHGIEAKMLVILQPGDPDSTLELFLNGNKNKYEIYINFLNGDPLSKAGLK